MTADTIREVLHAAAARHMPRLTQAASQPDRVASIEDYLNETAVLRDQLEEGRLHVHDAMRVLVEEWDALEGWETALPPRRERTQRDIVDAKRKMRPELYGAIEDAKWLVRRLSEQIHRLEVDDANASRQYTVATGG